LFHGLFNDEISNIWVIYNRNEGLLLMLNWKGY